MSQFYLSIKGARQGQFKGTPNLRNSNDWMAGTRFSMQVDVPYDSGTGHPTGRRRYIPLTISKGWGAASLQILQAVANSETLNPVILEFIHTGAEGDESVWQRITLTNALIVDVRRYADFSAREIEQSPHEMEDISFVFQKIAVDDLIGSTHFLDDWSGPVAGPAGGPGRGLNEAARVHHAARRRCGRVAARCGTRRGLYVA